MSTVQILVDKFCPLGVSFVEVGSILKKINVSKALPKNLYKESGAFPIINQAQELIAGYSDDESYVVGKSKYIVFGDHTRTLKWIDFDFIPGESGTLVFRVAEGINPKFVFYTLLNLHIESRGYNRHWTVLKELKVQIPPTEVQNEIVRILDTFSNLEKELLNELETRKKQYTFYRESLFASDVNEEVKAIDQVATIWRGRRFVKDDILDSGVPAIHYGEIYTKFGLAATDAFSFLDATLASKLRFAKTKDVILVSAGETIEDIGKSFVWLGNQDVVIHDACYGIRSSVVDPKYMVHFFNTHNFRSQLRMYISTSKISSITPEKLGKVFIPVPSLERQREIVDALDVFDSLIEDINFGLPAEIETRRKQYEYYRGKLLDFKELESL